MRLLIAIKLVFLVLISLHVKAQKKYWVYHESFPKNFSITLLPEPENCSDWLNACSYFLQTEEVVRLRDAAISLTPVLTFTPLARPDTKANVGFALEQIDARHFIREGLNGQDVKIGIIDGGFLQANTHPSLKHFYEQNLVKGYRDYITPELEQYGGVKGLDDSHGTEVWQLVGGHDRGKNMQYGLATHAEYYLARTDHGGYEKRIEEDYLIEALEWMEEKGVRLVNVSLGYSTGFTNPKENYKVEHMDGKTTAIAKAIDIAALEKGMLIVVAAGNEATINSWQVLSTPGDARHALTVGASKFDVWDKMNYSSIGPEFIDYVKPDIAVYATKGTSFAAPVVTGMAACIWQHSPHLTNLEIIEILQKAGNFYPYPNNYLGYGVPTCSNVLQVLEGKETPAPKTVRVHKDKYVLRGRFDKYLVAFHKKDNRNVIDRSVYRPLGKKVKVKKPDEATQTSLLMGKKVLEIFWVD